MNTPEKYTKEKLVQIYNNEGGGSFSKACDYVKTLVPDKLLIDGEEFHHYPTLYDAEGERFFYIQITTGNERYLRKTQIDEYSK